MLSGPVLDTDGEPWIGSFPGLGRVFVDSDGAVEIECDVAGTDRAQAIAALRAGWGEPLSWTRRGYWLARGTTVAPPPSECDDGALLIAGSHADLLLPAAVRAGWRVQADGLVPVHVAEAGLEALPREVPALVSRHAHPTGPAVRPGSDVVVLRSAREARPRAVRAVALVDRRSVGLSERTEIVGRERLVMGAGLLVGRVIMDDATAATQLHMSLASLPAARWPLDHGEDAEGVFADVVDWSRSATRGAA